MSSLYIKYRPTKFRRVAGRQNRETINALRTMVGRDFKDVPHAFLFSGPTGCGKTTLARILGERLGCVGSDFREIDSADFRGIDTIREIRKRIHYRPMEGESRVWLLDECHKLSNDAQNALLKALEDTPPHVYFILCTTEPEKLIKTIRGRCTPMEVYPLTEGEIVRLLGRVAKREGKQVSKRVLEQIALDSLGHPRNALQLLDKVIDLPAKKQLALAKRTAEKQSEVIELCRALIKNKGWPVVRQILKGMKSEDPEKVRRAVLGYCNSVLLNSNDPRAFLIMDALEEPVWNIGWPGITLACYRVVSGNWTDVPY